MLLQGKTPKQVCSRIGVALLCMMLVWQAVGGVGVAMVMMFVPSLSSISWMTVLLNDATLYLFGFPVFLLIMRTVPNGAKREDVPAPFGLLQFLAVLVVSFGAMYIGNMVTMALYALSELATGGSTLDLLGSLTNGVGALPNFLLLAVVPAVGEEFIFRYMIRQKMRGAGDWNYILLSSVAFAFFHANIQQMLYAFILGVIFAWVYVRTEKIWLPMLLHLLINTMGIVVAPALSEAGLDIAVVVIMLGSIVGGIVLFVVFLKGARAAMRPPVEPGWPLGKAGRLADVRAAAQRAVPSRNAMYGEMAGMQPQYVDLPVAPAGFQAVAANAEAAAGVKVAGAPDMPAAPAAYTANPVPALENAGTLPASAAAAAQMPVPQAQPLPTGFAGARTTGRLDHGYQPYNPHTAMAQQPYVQPANPWVPPEQQAARQAQYAQYAGYGPSPSRGMLFGNFGMVFYLVVTGGLALAMFAVPLIISSMGIDMSAFGNLGA